MKTHSALCRTKPSGRAVARHGPSGPCATGHRVAKPQINAASADSHGLPCESPDSRNVNRPPVSFSHRSAAQILPRVFRHAIRRDKAES